jgi:hypothetical protein
MSFVPAGTDLGVKLLRTHKRMLLERIHAVLRNMLHTSKLNMAEMVKASVIDVFLSDTTWAICSTYHAVLKPPQVQQSYLDKICYLTFRS